jgi:hypothetical protein
MCAGGVESKISYCQLKTCKEKCKHKSIIRTYFGIECSLSRSTILISVTLNAATVQGSSEISFRCLANSWSNVSFSATGGKGDARLSDEAEGPLCCRTRTWCVILDVVLWLLTGWFSVRTAPVYSNLYLQRNKTVFTKLLIHQYERLIYMPLIFNEFETKTDNYIKHIVRNKNHSILTINDQLCFKVELTQKQIINIYSFL